MIVKAASCQLRIDVTDVAGNRARAAEAVTEAARRGARLVVLPELACSGYVFTGPEEARERAEPADGRTVTDWCALSAEYGLVLVGGFCELGEDGHVYNSAVLVDAGEPRAVYRKVHLWDAEKDVFRPGVARPPVVATSVGRVAVMICYDAEFPEWHRLAAQAGAQIIALPTNWPDEGRPPGERPLEVVRVQAGAAANRVFVVAADRCGTERGVSWVGGSAIVGPDGFPLAGPVADPCPELLLADLDPARADRKDLNPRNHVFTDRRPDLY
ncbi:nitrilase family protein [Pseudonocardia eucalypti]|uniref:Nitrilase family protein n=1 Tax=Pseudonocardia eucalypti TaxID=648755 RepID=A0ABP9QEA4_9PSEU|nr:putative amidohydrolase [Pseudonocardia eucalypti]